MGRLFGSRALGLLLAVAVALPAVPLVAQTAASPYLVVPRYDGRTTEELFQFDLGTGAGWRFDGIRSSPEEIRARRMAENLFALIGRPTDQPARLGEIFVAPIRDSGGTARSALFVEASTGYVAYFDDFGRRGELGRMITTLERPFEPIKALDAAFALLERRDPSGETVGAYLYHGPSGRGLYLSGLEELEIDPPVQATAELPKLTGPLSTTPITVDEETRSHLVIDQGTGLAWFFDLTGSVTRLVPRRDSLDLGEAFSGDTRSPTVRRFVPVSLQDDDDTTRGVLIVDVATGAIGLLDGPRSASPRVLLAPVNLYDRLRRDDAPRAIAAAPQHDGGGRTRGVWLLDNLTRAHLYVDRPDSPADLRLLGVTVER